MSDDVEIPEGLRPVKSPVDPVAAARRAERLVAEVRAADAKGLLGYERVNRALATINADLLEVGMMLNKVANSPRLFVLQQHRHGKRIIGPHGDLAALSEFSRLQNSYRVLYESMTEIELVWETRKQ